MCRVFTVRLVPCKPGNSRPQLPSKVPAKNGGSTAQFSVSIINSFSRVQDKVIQNFSMYWMKGKLGHNEIKTLELGYFLFPATFSKV